MDVVQKFAWQHRTGVGGLLAIYPKDKILKGCIWPFFITTGLCLGFVLTKTNMQDIIKNVSDTTISVLPNILGFLLGGYTILIGFGNVELLKSTTQLVKGRPISLFQMLSSIFALTIFVQALTLCIGLLFHFTLLVPIVQEGVFTFMYDWVPVLNLLGVAILLFAFFYSVFSLRDMVMNVFGFAQMYHMTLSIERMQDEVKSKGDIPIN